MVETLRRFATVCTSFARTLVLLLLDETRSTDSSHLMITPDLASATRLAGGLYECRKSAICIGRGDWCFVPTCHCACSSVSRLTWLMHARHAMNTMLLSGWQKDGRVGVVCETGMIMPRIGVTRTWECRISECFKDCKNPSILLNRTLILMHLHLCGASIHLNMWRVLIHSDQAKSPPQHIRHFSAARTYHSIWRLLTRV